MVLCLALAAAVAVVAWPEPDAAPQPAPVRGVVPEVQRAAWIDVTRAGDVGKPGVGRSVMGQVMMHQEARTSGPSPDSLRFRFDAPVEITGVMVSVDISGPTLVEVAAGVNVEGPYGISDGHFDPDRENLTRFAGRDWLIHTSDSNGGAPSKIDEQVTLPVPVELAAGDWIAVDGWVGNESTEPTRVSPEVIVFYRWV